MYRVFPLILLFLLTAGLNLKAQIKEDSTRPAKLTEDGVLTYESDSVRKSYKKVLVTSFGSINARYFTDILYSPLSGQYSRREIGSTTEYLGSTPQALNKNLPAAIQKHQPDAVLAIYDSENEDTLIYKKPLIDRRLLNLLTREGPYAAPRKTVGTVTNKNAQQFMAVLVEPTENKVVWRGEIFVFSNFSKRKALEHIAGLLMAEWTNNNLFAEAAPPTREN
jgi:hypothetical protein